MAKKRILLVDDEKSLTTLLKLNLEETGHLIENARITALRELVLRLI